MQLVAEEARERQRAKQAFLFFFFPSSKNVLPLFAIMHDASMRTGAHNAGHELYAVAACRCKRYFRLHSWTRPLLRSCMRSFPLPQRLAWNETTEGAVMSPLSHGVDRFRSCVSARPAVRSDLAFFPKNWLHKTMLTPENGSGYSWSQKSVNTRILKGNLQGVVKGENVTETGQGVERHKYQKRGTHQKVSHSQNATA